MINKPSYKTKVIEKKNKVKSIEKFGFSKTCSSFLSKTMTNQNINFIDLSREKSIKITNKFLSKTNLPLLSNQIRTNAIGSD